MTSETTDSANQSAKTPDVTEHDGPLDPGSGPIRMTNEDGEEVVIHRRTGREDMDATIAERHRQRRAREEAERDAAIEEEAASRGERKRAATAETQEPEPDRKPAADSEPPMVEVKLFGETQLVPRSVVDAAGGVAAYQMSQAAERNFRESKRLLDEAREMRLRMEEEGRAPTSAVGRPPAAPAASAEFGDDGLTEEQRAHLEEMGEEYDEVVVDTRRLALIAANRLASTQANDSQVVERVLQEQERRQARAAQEENSRRFENERASANSYFSQHFSEIERDPDLAFLAQKRIRDLYTANPRRALVEIVKEAGEYVSSRYLPGSKRQGAFDVRVERKRTTSRAPQPTAGGRVPPTPREPEPQPKTGSDIVREMQAARPGAS